MASRANNQSGQAREKTTVSARDGSLGSLAGSREARAQLEGHCRTGRPSGRPCCPPGQSPARRGRLHLGASQQCCPGPGLQQCWVLASGFKGVRTEPVDATIYQLSWGTSFWIRGYLGSPKRKRASATSPRFFWVRPEREFGCVVAPADKSRTRLTWSRWAQDLSR